MSPPAIYQQTSSNWCNYQHLADPYVQRDIQGSIKTIIPKLHSTFPPVVSSQKSTTPLVEKVGNSGVGEYIWTSETPDHMPLSSSSIENIQNKAEMLKNDCLLTDWSETKDTGELTTLPESTQFNRHVDLINLNIDACGGKPSKPASTPPPPLACV